MKNQIKKHFCTLNEALDGAISLFALIICIGLIMAGVWVLRCWWLFLCSIA